MEQSETIGALAAALAKAQGAMRGAIKDANNPHFKSKYADLASVWDACRDALSANGLSVIQAPGPCEGNQLSVTTILAHSSGEWMRERLTIPLSKVDAQGYGSAVTYGRRYALSAMVGIAPEDDDGNAAVNPGPNAAPNNATQAFISEDQVMTLQALAEGVGADIPKFCSYLKVKTLSAIPASQFQRAVSALEAKRKAA